MCKKLMKFSVWIRIQFKKPMLSTSHLYSIRIPKSLKSYDYSLYELQVADFLNMSEIFVLWTFSSYEVHLTNIYCIWQGFKWRAYVEGFFLTAIFLTTYYFYFSNHFQLWQRPLLCFSNDQLNEMTLADFS